MVVGRLLSYWETNFSGVMLNFGGVRVGFLLLLVRLVQDSEYTLGYLWIVPNLPNLGDSKWPFYPLVGGHLTLEKVT